VTPVPDNEENYITDQFVGHKSLKAWKVEHEKEVAANEAKNRKKSPPKGGKSPTGGKDSKAAGKDSKMDKKAADRPKSSKSNSPTGKGAAKPKAGGSRENSPKGGKVKQTSK
jgi:hypothetical protein